MSHDKGKKKKKEDFNRLIDILATQVSSYLSGSEFP
jgi:hypothetical protein